MDEITHYFISTSPRLRYLISNQEREPDAQEHQASTDAANDSKESSSCRSDTLKKDKTTSAIDKTQAEIQECMDDLKSKFKMRSRDPKFVIEVLTLIAVAVYAGLTYWQGTPTGTIIHNTSAQFVQDQRPYIWLTNDLGSPVPFSAPGDIRPDK